MYQHPTYQWVGFWIIMFTMYLLTITFGLCVSYLVLLFLFPYLFEKKLPKLNKKHLFSLALIFLISLIGYAITASIPDFELSNRLLHGFGGGFMAFLVCFLAAKDARLGLNKFQFFLISVLIVTALGVTNEIIEFLLQNYAGMLFAPHINDTWLDLISNTIGMLIASLCFVPLVNKKRFDLSSRS